MAALSRAFAFLSKYHWAAPRSLAATRGISVDLFSSSYLDVSVRLVCLPNLCIQLGIILKDWVAPFRNRRIKTYSRFPDAYRSVSRLSSPLYAKAFTRCPYLT